MRTEEFPISNEIIEKFIKVNRKEWYKDAVIKSDKYIYINLSMVRMQVAWIIPKILFAKGLEEEFRTKVIVLTWNNNEYLKKFFESYNIEHLSINDYCKKDIVSLIKAALITILFLIKDGTGDGLKKIRLHGIRIGDGIYEDILRTSDLSTIKKCNRKIIIKKILHILWSSISLESLLKKKPAKFAITDDMAYHENIFIKIFKSQGARVFACSNVAEKEIALDQNGNVERDNYYERNRYIKEIANVTDSECVEVDELLKQRFAGENGRDIDRIAFKGKKVLSKEELQNRYNLSKNKKNIVIMAHTFTDAVFNYGEYYFRDYYDWLEKTLQIAGNVTNVNWIIKPHPARKLYNEEYDSIESMYDRYKKNHIYMLNDSISTESIAKIANAIITIGGTAGAEFACLGIPSIIIGKPYYYHFGFTIEPQTYEEYKEVLTNISEIVPLNEKQIEIAKKLFYLKNSKSFTRKHRFNDDFSDIINNMYEEMTSALVDSYFNNNSGTKSYNDKILEEIIKYMESHDMKSTAYYNRAKSISNL